MKTITSLVDEIITPEYADKEARSLGQLLLITADPDSEEKYAFALEAARYAFSKTNAFEKEFKAFLKVNKSKLSGQKKAEILQNAMTKLEGKSAVEIELPGEQ